MPLHDRNVLDLVMDAFDGLGGRATLQAHYTMMRRLCGERGVECPSEEHVRITIYNYTPGRKNYLHKGNYFAIVGRGEYRVTRPTLEEIL